MTAIAAVTRKPWLSTSRIPGLRGNIAVSVSALFLVVVIVAAALAPVLAPYSPSSVDLGNVLSPPGVGGHLLGTDTAGRDVLSRLLFGARISFLAPLLIVVCSAVAGAVLGIASGWLGGITDSVISRVMDFLFAFPALLLGMIAVALFGTGLTAPIVGLIIAYTPYTARLTRNLVAQERSRPYVEAYRLQGFSGGTIAGRLLFPNVLPTLLAQTTLGFGYALLDLAGLSFLGFGVQPPTADWGVMVGDAQQGILQDDIWVAVFPCAAIILTVIAFSVVGDWIGERLGRTEAA